MKKIGAHVSIAGGVENAPDNAADLKLETFQMFARSPRGGKAAPYTDDQIATFKKRMKAHGFTRFYIHTPYFINLASANNRIRYGSISAIREDLERGSQLGATAVMTHIGSAKDLGKKEAMKKAGEGLAKILDGYTGKTRLLVEISAGAGEIIGDTFEEIAELIKPLKLGVCFDTQHAFASGYDLRTKEAVDKTLADFDKKIGLKHMVLSHLNDSMTPFDSKKDRHEHLGEGEIGAQGLTAFLKHPGLAHIDVILETPRGEKIVNDVEFLKALR